MALPTQKRSKSRSRVKQYRYRLKKINLLPCSKCQKPVLPHHLCSFCGVYNNKKVMDIKTKTKTKEKKPKAEKTKK